MSSMKKTKEDPMDRIMNSKSIVGNKNGIRTDIISNNATNTPSISSTTKTTDSRSTSTHVGTATTVTAATNNISIISSSCHKDTISTTGNNNNKTNEKQHHHEQQHENDIMDDDDDDDKYNNTNILFQNIMNAYVAAMKCQLVPSILLELQLILRLLCVEDHNNKISNKSNNKNKNENIKIHTIIEQEPYIGSEYNGSTTSTTINTIAARTPTTTATTTDMKIQHLFASKTKCQKFAIEILRIIISMISNLPQDITISILKLNPIQSLLPMEFIQEVHDCLERKMMMDDTAPTSHRNDDHGVVGRQRRGKVVHNNGSCHYGLNTNNDGAILHHHHQHGNISSSSSVLLGSMTKSTILNVSFDEKRDSRHNFKSKDLGSLYNNREQCRGEYVCTTQVQ
jgi:hypothetical protein